MTCNGDKEKKGHLVKRTVPKNSASASPASPSASPASPASPSGSTPPSPSISGKASGSCIPSLKGVTL